MKSALFVDFDNVFSLMRQLQPVAAEQFARHPDVWIRWLADSLELPEPHGGEAKRRLLVRRCYLNPNWYQSYRHAFLRAGFEIVDCPPVTSQGKTSTDIHLVLDAVELLQHETRYDEFIVFSADADFTPLLRKLRRHDRRTTVLALGFPSAAYQASADLLIPERVFVGEALFAPQEGNGSLDPARHEYEGGSANEEPESPWAAEGDLFKVVKEVCSLTRAPMLTPQELREVLKALSAELAETGFQPASTPARVCSRCLASAGMRVRQRDVTFLIRGMQLNGHVFGRGDDDVATLGSRLLAQVLFLCEREQMVLDDAAAAGIRRWVTGEPPAPPVAAGWNTQPSLPQG